MVRNGSVEPRAEAEVEHRTCLTRQGPVDLMGHPHWWVNNALTFQGTHTVPWVCPAGRTYGAQAKPLTTD